MTKAEIIAFMNANKDAYLATVEGNKPHVRGMGIIKADENGIIIQTSTYKDLYKQLLANPNVELCFHNPKDGIQVRVSGAAKPVDDIKLKDEIIALRSFLKPQVEKKGYEAIVVYRLKGKATVWTFKTNFDPKTYIQI
jgi:pyridoxamine 5'-phosphate oxidase